MSKFLIKHPIISEKSTNLSAFGKYVFLVHKKATKPEIKKNLKTLYKVDAKDVRVINIKSKKIFIGRMPGIKPGYKKAIVTLKKGQKLDIIPK